ncbi:hypothetical protein ACE6H2_010304 [Prunus campanulata]
MPHKECSNQSKQDQVKLKPKVQRIKRVEGGGASTRVRALYTFQWESERSCFGLAVTTRRRGQIKEGEKESNG